MNKYTKTKQQLLELEKRLITFLRKLEERMTELGEASIREVKTSYQNKADFMKKYNFISGIVGQFNSIGRKAEKVYDDNVSEKLEDIGEYVSNQQNDNLQLLYDKVYDNCELLNQQFSEKVNAWIEALHKAGEPDYEKEYQEVLEEYELIKNNFQCKQCGSPILIPQIFVTTTYVTCEYCKTQNTFQPSSQASNLDAIGKSLAHQRSQYLLDAYNKEEENERAIYAKIHKLTLERISHDINNNTAKATEITKQIAQLEQQRLESERRAPALYIDHMNAKFEEWYKLVPQLEEQNRKVYASWLKEYATKKKRH